MTPTFGAPRHESRVFQFFNVLPQGGSFVGSPFGALDHESMLLQFFIVLPQGGSFVGSPFGALSYLSHASSLYPKSSPSTAPSWFTSPSQGYIIRIGRDVGLIHPHLPFQDIAMLPLDIQQLVCKFKQYCLFTRRCMMGFTYCRSFQVIFIFLEVLDDGHSSFPSSTPFINTATTL